MKKIQLGFPKLASQKMIVSIYGAIMIKLLLTAAKLGDKVGVSESTVVRSLTSWVFKGLSSNAANFKNDKNSITTVQRIEMTSDYSNEENV